MSLSNNKNMIQVIKNNKLQLSAALRVPGLQLRDGGFAPQRIKREKFK